MSYPDGVPSPGSTVEAARDSGLTVTVHNNGEAVVLEVGGEVDLLTVPPLRDAVMKALQSHPPVLVLDLLSVHFFGSSGLAMLLEAQQFAGEHTRLRVVADGPATRRPLQITGLDQQLDLYPTREDALRNA